MVIRRIDDLGRLQLPKDYRKTLDIYEGDELVIELKDGYMSVKKEEKKIGEEGMKRLTKLKGKYVWWNGNQDFSMRDRYAKVLDRLAAYEDTGLTPEQIQAQQQEIKELKDQNDTLYDTVNMFAPYIIGKKETEVVEDLKELLTLKQQITALIADKDEQAGRIMRMENMLYQAKDMLQMGVDYLNHDKPFDPLGSMKIAIKAIDALLEDEKVFSFAHCAYEFRPATCKGIGVNCDTCGHGKLIERVSEDRGGAKDGK